MIFNWQEKILDTNRLAEDIAKATNLPYRPKLIPFGERRALFFCSSFVEATRVLSISTKFATGTLVTLDRWNTLVNTFDPRKVQILVLGQC